MPVIPMRTARSVLFVRITRVCWLHCGSRAAGGTAPAALRSARATETSAARGTADISNRGSRVPASQAVQR